MVEEFGASGSVPEVTSGSVGGGEDGIVLAATVETCDLLIFFRTPIDVSDASSNMDVESFAASLDILVGRELEVLVDFCRVPIFPGSMLSAGLDSDTTFFGLPLFFTTSADILVELLLIDVRISPQMNGYLSAAKLFSRVTTKDNAT